jgi:predicted ATPase/catalase/class 3 adenylate cyclase
LSKYPSATETESLASSAGSRDSTILTTDIVGSTALLRRYPNDTMAAMDLHDQILHAAIRRRSGDPFRHTGDGVLAIFERPLDAVLAAIDAQREMRGAAWGPTGRLQVRWGIHTGLTRARGGGDFFGPSLPTATRLQGAANADQILLSAGTAAGLAIDRDQKPFDLSDLGLHHFKGIEPIRVYQVRTSDLPSAFPPIGGKRETASGNLPANLSSFLGRERELADLAQMARESRLMTLVGSGGIGKTRLAIAFARTLESSFPDGAWLVDLSALERDSEVWPAIAEALLIPSLPGVERRIQVLERLSDARAILLMDNCEHVLDPIAEAVTELGTTCSSLFLINTSRRTLGVEGEALYQVSSLDSGLQDGPGRSAAVRLFVERGRLADRRFEPTPDDLAVIQRICANLDYIPLAIEIAGGHLRRLSLENIENGVTRPLDLQSGNFRRRVGRQQTLRQTLEWSYDLLEPNSRKVLQRLSVFSGPFHEVQALAVCAGDMLYESDVLRGIDELVESSLLARDAGGHQLLRMLQTVQAFGREKLDQTSLLQTVETRHGEVYAGRCRELGQRIASVNEAKAASAIYDELSNLRAAFERAITRDLKLAADMAASLFLFNYFHRGAETSNWYERIMARPGADELEQAPILLAGAAGHAFHDEGDQKKAAAFIERGFQLEAAGSRSSHGWLSGVAGQMAQWSGDTEACLEHHATAIERARRVGNTPCEITSLCMAAFVKARTGDLDGAGELVREVTQIGQTAMQPTLMGYIHYARGSVESFKDRNRAVEEYQTSVEWANMAGNHLGALRVKQLIADLQAAQAEPTEALAIHVSTLMDLPNHGATFYTWLTIRSLLAPLSELEADEELAILAGALHVSPLKLDRSARNAVNIAKERLGDVAFESATARGSKYDLARVRKYITDVWGSMGQQSSEAGSGTHSRTSAIPSAIERDVGISPAARPLADSVLFDSPNHAPATEQAGSGTHPHGSADPSIRERGMDNSFQGNSFQANSSQGNATQSDPLQAKRLVDAVISDFPDHKPGTRPVHTIGVGVDGYFLASDVARTYCIAEHFKGQQVRATVRFSNGSGSPVQHDGWSDVRGMATRFHLEDGRATDLIAMTLGEFFAQTVDDFFAFTKASVPKPIKRENPWRKILDLLSLKIPLRNPMPGEKKAPDAGMLQYANQHRFAQLGVFQAGSIGAPVSYVRATYHAVHTFVVIAPDGIRRNVRFSWQPVAGVRTNDPYNPKDPPPRDNYLRQELEERLASWPARFMLMMTIGEAGDAFDDPTRPWPAKRIRVVMGTLTLTNVAADQDANCEQISFNPCRLLPGIEASGDPILHARRDAYEDSRKRRHGVECPFNRS